MTIKSAISKFVALLLISIPVAFLAVGADSEILAKADSMSGTDFIAYVRGLFHHSFVHHYILMFIIGGFFIASVEFVSYVIGLCFKKKAAG